MASPEVKELPHNEKGVIFALLRDNKILLSLKIKPDSAYWGMFILPGGRFERGENAEEALMREVLEECDVIPTSFRPLFQKDMITEAGNHVFQHIYMVTDFEGEVVNKESEIEQHEWVRLDKAEDFLELEFSKEIIRRVVSALNKEGQNRG